MKYFGHTLDLKFQNYKYFNDSINKDSIKKICLIYKEYSGTLIETLIVIFYQGYLNYKYILIEVLILKL